MMYKVKVTFKYSDTVEVEASTEEEAKLKAVVEADESYECLYDAEIVGRYIEEEN